jgi:hypothetical protein
VRSSTVMSAPVFGDFSFSPITAVWRVGGLERGDGSDWANPYGSFKVLKESGKIYIETNQRHGRHPSEYPHTNRFRT